MDKYFAITTLIATLVGIINGKFGFIIKINYCIKSLKAEWQKYFCSNKNVHRLNFPKANINWTDYVLDKIPEALIFMI